MRHVTSHRVTNGTRRTFVRVLQPRLQPRDAEQMEHGVVLFFSDLGVPFLRLLFCMFLRYVTSLLPTRRPPRNITRENDVLAKGSFRQRPNRVPLRRLVQRGKYSIVVSRRDQMNKIVFADNSIRRVLGTRVHLHRRLRKDIQLISRVMTIVCTVAL